VCRKGCARRRTEGAGGHAGGMGRCLCVRACVRVRACVVLEGSIPSKTTASSGLQIALAAIGAVVGAADEATRVPKVRLCAVASHVDLVASPMSTAYRACHGQQTSTTSGLEHSCGGSRRHTSLRGRWDSRSYRDRAYSHMRARRILAGTDTSALHRTCRARSIPARRSPAGSLSARSRFRTIARRSRTCRSRGCTSHAPSTRQRRPPERRTWRAGKRTRRTRTRMSTCAHVPLFAQRMPLLKPSQPLQQLRNCCGRCSRGRSVSGWVPAAEHMALPMPTALLQRALGPRVARTQPAAARHAMPAVVASAQAVVADPVPAALLPLVRQRAPLDLARPPAPAVVAHALPRQAVALAAAAARGAARVPLAHGLRARQPSPAIAARAGTVGAAPVPTARQQSRRTAGAGRRSQPNRAAPCAAARPGVASVADAPAAPKVTDAVRAARVAWRGARARGERDGRAVHILAPRADVPLAAHAGAAAGHAAAAPQRLAPPARTALCRGGCGAARFAGDCARELAVDAGVADGALA
jgi:hypothetical protein